MELDIDVHTIRETRGEQLDLLCRGQVICDAHGLQELLLICFYRAPELEPSQLAERVAPKGQPKALIAEVLKMLSRWRARVVLEHEVLVLRDAGEVIGGQPDLVYLQDALAAKELLTTI